MTLRHWSRVTPYTSPCGLAECCVFAKQSPEPLHCGSQAPGGASPPDPRERPFFRSYGAGLPSSLTWFLPSTSVYSTRPPVSVCGTDPRGVKTLRRFSWRHGASPFPPGEPGGPHHGSGNHAPAFHSALPCPLGPAVPAAGGPSLPRHAIAVRAGPRNVDLEHPSATPFGLALGPG